MHFDLNKTIGIGLVALLALLASSLHQKDSRKAEMTVATAMYQEEVLPQKVLVDPIDRAGQRVTKKSFGTYVTPKNSPVAPERFTGFHTGTDFETFAEEADVDVSVYAICDGSIVDKKTAAGYGGYLIQSCSINHQPITVVYGHLNLNSVAKNKGNPLTAGERIGDLGPPPQEAGGERKHLHLGIHKGMKIDTRGYVQKESELTAWMDWEKL